MPDDDDDFNPIDELVDHPAQIETADRELLEEVARRYAFDEQYRRPLIDWAGSPATDSPEGDAWWEVIPEHIREEQVRRWDFEDDFGRRHQIAWLKAENAKLRQIIVESITGEHGTRDE